MSSHSRCADLMARCLSARCLLLSALLLLLVRLLWDGLRLVVPESEQLYLPLSPERGSAVAKGTVCVNGTCREEGEDYLGPGLHAHGDNFYLDGQRFRIISGSFHYFRTQPADWGDRLLKLRSAGLNTVTTYIPWNLHEPVKGLYEFTGRWDLASFIKQAQQVGLKVIIRPGPYICAEWEFGGLPSWLLKDPDMRVRTSYDPFLVNVGEYFKNLLPILAPLTYKRGGPIIALQVENEYGSYGTDQRYLKYLVEQYQRHGLADELLFTSDGTKQEQMTHGSIPGVLLTANFKDKQKEHLSQLKAFQPDKPLMVAEFWPGWFDHWSETHNGMTDEIFRESVTNILEAGASINFYMFVGGTSFEFWNGANFIGNEYKPTITSYDYDAPISEDGSLKEKFFITRELVSRFEPGVELPPPPSSLTATAYGRRQVVSHLSYRSLTDFALDFSHGVVGHLVTRDQPLSMELLGLQRACGQSRGFLLYRADILTDRGHEVSLRGSVRDRGVLLLNHRALAVWDRREEPYAAVRLPETAALEHGRSHLDVLVENMGRVNYLQHDQGVVLDTEHKGLLGSLHMDGAPLTGWTHIPLDFSSEFTENLSGHSDLWRGLPPDPVRCPAIFRVHLDLDSPPTDTHLDMRGWTKGVVVVNGYPVGRYWRVGPQRSLYIPASLLVQGTNVVLIFELHEAFDSVTFRDKPMLDESW